MSNLIENDLAFDLYAEWEDRQANGDPISLEQFCADHPQIYPQVLQIAQKIQALSLAPVMISSLTDTVVSSTDNIIHSESPPMDRSEWVEIGRGASSVVYRGYDPDFETEMAYKVLHPNQAVSKVDLICLVKRFEQEAHILAKLKHEGIVRIFKSFLDQGRPILEMEYLPGKNLGDRASEIRDLGVFSIAQFMERVARAVGFAHQKGIVHRDLKPNNILLDHSGLPCVSDFGIAKLLQKEEIPNQIDGGEVTDQSPDEQSNLTNPFRQPGTKAYMAPEQFDPSFGSVSPATDVWAVGVILFELLYGSRPFQGNSWSEWKDSVCTKPIVFPRHRWGKKAQISRVIRRCLARDPIARYASGIDLADSLASLTRPRIGMGVLILLLMIASLFGAIEWMRNFMSSPDTSHAEFQTLEPPWVNREVERTHFRELKEGKKVLLLGDGDHIGYRSIGEKPNIKIDQGKLIIQSPDTVFIELLSGLPKDGTYRIRAKMDHQTGQSNISFIGLFAGGSGTWTDKEWAYQCAYFSHSEMGASRGISQSMITRIYQTNDSWPKMHSYELPNQGILQMKEKNSQNYQLRVDGKLEISSNLPVPPVPLDEFEQYTRQFAKRYPLSSGKEEPFGLNGAIGIYVRAAEVQVHSVEIEQLKSPEQ